MGRGGSYKFCSRQDLIKGDPSLVLACIAGHPPAQFFFSGWVTMGDHVRIYAGEIHGSAFSTCKSPGQDSPVQIPGGQCFPGS